MNEDDAREKLTDFLGLTAEGANYPFPDQWKNTNPFARQLSEDKWLFSFDREDNPAQGVVISSKHEPVPFWGGLGKLVTDLGLPTNRELFSCSTTLGKYQIFENGMGIWEGDPNIAYPLHCDVNEIQTGKNLKSISAFIDIRGFTTWSNKSNRTSDEIQTVVRIMEQSFQDAFAKLWCWEGLFAKGTGDGILIVSEDERYKKQQKNNSKMGMQNHAALFTASCAYLIVAMKKQLPKELAVGCGITIGEITRVFLLGRQDYIGPSVNEAAKIQQLGYNEICISNEFYRTLRKDFCQIKGYMLAGKGWRLNPEKYIEKLNDSGFFEDKNS